ncbi:hypothetical protein [uncultured Bacteroides sp.]|uniref:hypothetical protein n=1 Tax=uncultured Bacteroides sp. TaxID=162156 RepID=UPI00259CD4FD|nr:hypothetical protein [uncultured Bacteroides sp.]
MKKTISYFLFICGLLMVAATSCKDDLLYTDGGPIPEGESIVTAQVDFKPLVEGLADKSRSAGDTIKSINALCVLLYDVDGNLAEAHSLTLVTGEPGEGEYRVSDIERKKEDAVDPNGNIAETETPRAKLSLKIPYGRYYIYAVANMGTEFNEEVKSDGTGSSEAVNKYKEAIKTVEGLKSISLTWNADDVARNNQMFGHFTIVGQENKSELLTINKKKMELHSWIRRAASKVTIAYDGSGLEDGVFIYLKSVTIKDIPQKCYLGKNNPAAPEDLKDGDEGVKLDLIPEGETIKYYKGDGELSPSDFNETYEARITKGKPLFGSKRYEEDAYHPENLADVHTEFTNALYFYENMQGMGKEGTTSDKRQVVKGDQDPTKPTYPDGGAEENEAWKDAKPYGTYIEVDAFYVSINEKKVGRGPIKYRFMLGKDVITDYNAERNHHYKLTLKFKGYANDADWHIEYEEPEPGIEVPNPYYISYLYNRTMNLPVKINTAGGTLISLKAEILTNNWAPHGTLSLAEGGLDYARAYDYAENPNDESLNQPWNGFLSFRKTTARILIKENDPDKDQVPVDLTIPGTVKITSNKDYYETSEKGLRTYNVAKQLHEDKDGNYEIKGDNDHLLASIPLYTRAKQMHIKSGYTGNNPYVAYQRHAKVKIIAVVQVNGKDHSLDETVDIYQVRRIVNPKGIYRSNNNNRPFDVTLLRLPKENAEDFIPFSSEGPWKAYVVSAQTEANRGEPSYVDPNPGFITLSVLDNKNTRLEDGVIYGVTGSDIKFKINFNETIAKGASNKNAVVRVEYHNYTCEHLIFVHQGSQPQELLSGKPAWHVSNLVSQNKEALNPLDEGSLFRYKNLTQPITAKNQYNKQIMINVKSDYFPDPVSQTGQYELEGTTEKVTWGNITNQQAESTESWGLNLEKTRIAKLDDYESLFESNIIAQSYGVLYGDESTEPETNIVDAYGYQEHNEYSHPGNPPKKNRGMRGCFVYNRNNGNHIFFPVGASGYGHRRTKENGCLRYSCGQTGIFSNLALAPLFYDLYMRPGAVYWTEDVTGTGAWGTTVGWDINYFTFDFNRIYQANVFDSDKSDACFIRCVEDSGSN